MVSAKQVTIRPFFVKNMNSFSYIGGCFYAIILELAAMHSYVEKFLKLIRASKN